jgi:hypothetical protein
MGLFGSGGGTLGLGGTQFDPFTWVDLEVLTETSFDDVTDELTNITHENLLGVTDHPFSETEETHVSPPTGTWLNARQGANLGVPIIYGTRRTGGHIIYQAMSSNENMLYVVYALAEGVQQTWTMYIDDGDGVMVDFDSSRYLSSYVDVTHIHTGATSKSPAIQHLYRNNISAGSSVGLVTNAGNFVEGLGSLWSTSHNCKGVAVEGLAFLYDNIRQFGNKAVTDTWIDGTPNSGKYFETEPFFRNGIPKIEFEMTGIALLDNTGATVSNSSDPSWILFDYLTNEDYGCGIDDSLINSASFITASTICNVESSSTDRYSCNIILDSRASLIDNIKLILSSCNGRLSWINGQYYLQIDDEFTGTAVFAFEEKHILGGIGIVANSKTERTNQVTCQFTNPDNSWEQDEVSWPDKNNETALYDSFLAADNEIPLRKTITVNAVTNFNQARFLAKQACLRSRDALKVTFKTTAEAMNVIVGDVITVTHSTPSWTAKEFRVRAISLNMDGTCSISASEQVDATYAFDYIAPPAVSNDTNLPDVLTVTAPTALIFSETTYQGIASGGKKIRVTLEWLRSDNIFVDHHDVEFKKSAETNWTDAGSTIANSMVLNDFEKGDFDFRVRAVNSIGSKSDWYTITNQKIEGITDPPQDVTGFAVSNHGSNAVVSWDAPTDSTDIDYIQIGVLQTGSTLWNDAVFIGKVGAGNTSVVLPAIDGNYVAKWINSSGLESADYLESGTVAKTGSELVATFAEQEAWAGTMDGFYETVDDGDDVLRFLGGSLIDSVTELMDTWTPSIDELGGRTAPAVYTGVKRDLGAVLPARIYSNKIFTSRITDGSNYVDSWGKVDLRESWDDVEKLDNLEVEVRITQDDPASAGATWTAYKPFVVVDVVCRGMQIKVTFDQFDANSQFTLRELELLVDMVVRVESDRAKTATSITYSNPFYTIPDLVVTPINMATGDYMTVSSEVKTGFNINFYNSSAVSQTRTYNYIARGV